MTTEEKNRMIAEFMGAKNKSNALASISVRMDENELWIPIHGIKNFKQLRYDSSWDWLMPVVDKIEGLEFYNQEVSLRISKYAVCFQTLDNDGFILNESILSKWGTSGGVDKLNATYSAVFEFIEWYNKNN